MVFSSFLNLSLPGIESWPVGASSIAPGHGGSAKDILKLVVIVGPVPGGNSPYSWDIADMIVLKSKLVKMTTRQSG